MKERVVELVEPAWDFDDGPRYVLDTGEFRRQQKVDPTPAYGHDVALVAETLARCESRFPVRHPPKIFCLRNEVTGRTNGWTGHEYSYDSSGKNKDEHGRPPTIPYIVLSGKRIPPHPAVTRYLVAHEYGHVVDTALAYKRYPDQNPEAKQDAEYIALRGVPPPAYYGPGTWHCSPGEVFANDFRILVCGIEPEYWPHPGIARPEASPAVVKWWADRISELREVNLETVANACGAI